MTDEIEPVAEQAPVPRPALKRAGRPLSARRRPVARREAEPEEARAEPRQERGRLKRKRRTADRLRVDPRLKRDGYDYEWKNESVAGQPDPSHMQDLKENHWSEVPPERAPGAVTRQKGMVLMERPAYLTEDARREDYEDALSAVQGVTERLGENRPGQFSREHPSARRVTGVKTRYERPIHED